MSWTKINKPTSSVWTAVTFEGKYSWDDPNVTYDDPNVYWDGANISAYTKLAKPAGNLVISAGMATGLLIPLTYSVNINSGDAWTKISKPN